MTNPTPEEVEYYLSVYGAAAHPEPTLDIRNLCHAYLAQQEDIEWLQQTIARYGKLKKMLMADIEKLKAENTQLKDHIDRLRRVREGGNA